MTNKLYSVESVANTVMDTMEKTVENDALQWNGLLVWEDGDSDTIHNILSNTVRNDRLTQHKAVVEILEREVRSTENGEVLSYLERSIQKVNQLFGVSK